MTTLLSIVIPVYKTEKYLVDSVNSILNQTYKNLEIILVDDGSPDSCPAICDEIASKDTRVQVIHKENGGLSSARNAGIDASTGEYILFLDSDDNLESFAIKDAVEIILDEESDAVYPNSYTKVIESTGEKTVSKHFNEADFNSDPKIFGLDILIGKGRAKRAHSVLYRNSILKDNNVCFLIGKISEDYFFNIDFLSVANKISMYKKPSLNYLKRNGSISTSYFENFFDTVLEMDDYALAFVEKLTFSVDEELLLLFEQPASVIAAKKVTATTASLFFVLTIVFPP